MLFSVLFSLGNVCITKILDIHKWQNRVGGTRRRTGSTTTPSHKRPSAPRTRGPASGNRKHTSKEQATKRRPEQNASDTDLGMDIVADMALVEAPNDVQVEGFVTRVE